MGGGQLQVLLSSHILPEQIMLIPRRKRYKNCKFEFDIIFLHYYHICTNYE